MEHWKKLDLRGKSSMPPLNSLAALYFQPVGEKPAFFRDAHYEIGYFKTESGRRKIWWHSLRGIDDPVKWRKHYDIWWRLIPECDCF